MVEYAIRIKKKGLQPEAIKRLVIDLRLRFKDAEVTSTKVLQIVTRADRLNNALEMVGDAKVEVQELRDELQEWYDNLPDNFQSGEKGEQLIRAISELEELAGELDAFAGREIEFPKAR